MKVGKNEGIGGREREEGGKQGWVKGEKVGKLGEEGCKGGDRKLAGSEFRSMKTERS